MLWLELKNSKLDNYKFTRQLPIGSYFVDFCCRKRKLVVEIDGSQHAGSEYDRKRDAFLTLQGYRVLRFWNHDVLTKRSEVCNTILAALDGRLASNVDAIDLRYKIPSDQLTLNQRVKDA